MKRLFRKRLAAYFLDVLIFAIFFELFRNCVKAFISITDSWGYFVVVALPLFIRDLIFRNGSIGKKVMGLIVVDNNWSLPSAFAIIKRSMVTTTIGYMLLFRLRVLNENWEMALLAELEWEYGRLKMRVVERKVYKALKREVSVNEKINTAAMDQLYDHYLYGKE